MRKWALLAAALFLQSCGGVTSTQAPSSGTAAPAANPKDVVATLNGKAITQEDLNEVIGSQLAQIQSQIYEVQKQGVTSIIEERLVETEAQKRGVSMQQLIKEEITDKAGDVTDKEVEEFYVQNKSRFGAKSLEEVKTPLKQQLFARKTAVYQQNFINRLKSKADIKINLVRPTIDVSTDNDPSLGSKNAKVTIIEFTDYQCPFCVRARPVVKQLVQEYGDKIYYVLRDFPLDFHANAKKAAEAAQCAEDEGKYWEYSDLLWSHQQELDVPNLKKYAEKLGLDTKKFDECLDSGKYAKEVEKDLQDGAKAGVSGTPSFFINGQMITGARPIEQFREIIDAELKNTNP